MVVILSFDYRILYMQTNKISLCLRKSLKKQPRQRVFHIKTQKYTQPVSDTQRIDNKQEIRQKHTRKLRHTSVISRKFSLANRQSKLRQNTSLSKNEARKQTKFPQIYNPTLSSAKFIDLKKLNQKFKISPTNLNLQKKRVQSEFASTNKKTEFQKHDSYSINKNVKPAELEPIRQMSKQKKQQIFKIIRSQFHDLINTSNNISVVNQECTFRAYVEKGNNGILVKQVLKKRWWWHIEEDKTKANLIWTEWFDKSATANLNNITLGDEVPVIDDYKFKEFDQVNNKKQVVKKLVDNQTYSCLQNRISLRSNTYFKMPKGSMGLTQSLKNIKRNSNFKVITVDDEQVIHNHVEGCLNLHSKKLLFMNFHKFMMQKQWDAFAYIPLTFYIQSRDSLMIEELLKKYDELQEIKKQNKELKNIWICKPGENSNRGCGIKVVKSKQEILSEINSRLPQRNIGNRSVIIQKYIQKCFLINNRKFDIRCYILLTTANGILKGYWYRDGYIRTSSIEYSLEDIENQMIHLTNDAVQKKGEDFGKHEDSNKLSFDFFKQYLKKIGENPLKFDDAYEKMKLIAYYLISSVTTKIKRKQYTFQLFGLDFMLDENLNPLLIEANSNPCLSNHGKILGKLIYELVENVFMTAIDPIFPPPLEQLNKKKKMHEQLLKDYFESNKFQLIFTSYEKPRKCGGNTEMDSFSYNKQKSNNKQ